jgi:hypothetical protein
MADEDNDPLDIGGVRYGMAEAVALRGEIIEMRNAAMRLDPPNMRVAVTLSHTVALLAALIQSKWPMEWAAAAAGKFSEGHGRRPAKYGEATISIEGVVANIEAMEDAFAEKWNEFKQNPSLETWSAMNEGLLRTRMLLDIASELLSAEEEGEG